jgi:hypothetical protein
LEPWRAVDSQNGGVEVQKGLWRVYYIMMADWHHFDEEQDFDTDTHQIEEMDPTSIKVKTRIRIR